MAASTRSRRTPAAVNEDGVALVWRGGEIDGWLDWAGEYEIDLETEFRELRRRRLA
jgi:hypothetical protein